MRSFIGNIFAWIEAFVIGRKLLFSSGLIVFKAFSQSQGAQERKDSNKATFHTSNYTINFLSHNLSGHLISPHDIRFPFQMGVSKRKYLQGKPTYAGIFESENQPHSRKIFNNEKSIFTEILDKCNESDHADINF